MAFWLNLGSLSLAIVCSTDAVAHSAGVEEVWVIWMLDKLKPEASRRLVGRHGNVEVISRLSTFFSGWWT
jgi:hypothetical protein